MTSTVLVGTGLFDCSAKTVGHYIETITPDEDCKQSWNRFAKEIDLEPTLFFRLTIGLWYKCTPVSEIYATATAYWCENTLESALLDDLCIKLDNANLSDAADALRSRFELQPVLRDLAIAPEGRAKVSHHMIANISSLTNTTTLTPTLRRLVRTVKWLTTDDIAFLWADMSTKSRMGKFYQIFINKPEEYPNLIRALVDDNQIRPAWILLEFYHGRGQPIDKPPQLSPGLSSTMVAANLMRAAAWRRRRTCSTYILSLITASVGIGMVLFAGQFMMKLNLLNKAML